MSLDWFSWSTLVKVLLNALTGGSLCLSVIRPYYAMSSLLFTLSLTPLIVRHGPAACLSPSQPVLAAADGVRLWWVARGDDDVDDIKEIACK